MKFYHTLALSSMLMSGIVSAQNVGIGTNTPNASAKLDIVDANRGLLIPRVALTATNAATPITSPSTSLLVYNTATAGTAPNNVTPGFYYWSGTAWVRFAAGTAGWELVGNGGTNPATNFIGTTDAIDFVVRTNNTERMRVTSAGNVGIGTTTPAQSLHVAGDIQFQNNLHTSAISRITPIAVRGTGYPTATPRIVDIGNNAIAIGGRGLTLVIIDKATHNVLSITNYDTHGATTEADNLATAINGVNQSQIGILVSFDAWELNLSTNARNAFRRVGLHKAANCVAASSLRCPYTAIFEAATGAINTASAVEIMHPGNITTGPHSELRGWLMEGGFVAASQQPSALTTPQGSYAAGIDDNANLSISNMAGGGNRNVYVDNNGTLRATSGTSNFTPLLFRYAITARTDYTDVNVGCDNVPEARFVILSLFYYNMGHTSRDHVNHIFGRSLPTSGTWVNSAPTDYYNHNDPAPGDYVIAVCPGENDNFGTYYGLHETLVVPLKSNKRIDIRLGDGYSGGTHYVKVRAVGYLP